MKRGKRGGRATRPFSFLHLIHLSTFSSFPHSLSSFSSLFTSRPAYDVTRRETFESLEDVWMREVDAYSTVDAAVRMVVANKADRESEREVPRSEGEAFAKRHDCLFAETSAKLGLAVGQAFEELVLKALDTPALLAGGSAGLAVGGGAPGRVSSSCC